MFLRVVRGRERVVREIRAAGPLAERLRAPLPARAPWLTAVLTASGVGRPVAVVVEPHRAGRPEGLALLALRSRGPVVEVTLLGDSPAVPAPAGRPPARLLAAGPDVAARLAAGVLDLLGSLHRPWSLRLAGLPLGCPTTAALAAAEPTAAFGSGRTQRLVDALDELGEVHRTTDPRAVDRALPVLLAAARPRARAFLAAAEPTAAFGSGRTQRLVDALDELGEVHRTTDPRAVDRALPVLLAAGRPRARAFLAAAARVHAATGEVELAVAGDPGRPRAALLTLLDRGERWPWWPAGDGAGVRREMGAPLVTLTATGGPRPRLPRRGVIPPRS